MRFAAVLVMLTALAGCAQYDEARESNLAAATRDQVAADEAACQSSGAPDSPAYNDCRKRLANEHASGTRSHQRVMDMMTNENNLRPIGQ